MSRSGKPVVTMADIARLAGVHVSTVSRALSDSPLVEKAMRERILKIASQHGYVANSTARNLRAGRTQTLSVVIPLAHERGQELTDPFFAYMLSHLADEITQRGYGMHLQKVLPPMQGWMQRIVAERRADGIIVIGQSTEHDTLERASRTQMPFVVWGGHFGAQHYPVVGTDNVQAGRLATEHLLTHGRRRILFVGDPSIPEIRLRCDGYRDALAQGPRGTAPATIVKAHMTPDAAYRSVLAHIGKRKPFDAIFAATDIIAISAMRALAASGRRIPDDVAVIGFDGIELGAHVHPTLTTIAQDLNRGAQLLVDLLLKRIAGEAVASVAMNGELLVRESCGAAART
ncbi:MAG TPA: LacI family DNA-binding transcriptional regulator [Pseudomonadales bacterium]